MRLWRRIRAWMSSSSAFPRGTPISDNAQPSPGIEQLLHVLGQQAWRKETRHPPESFLLAPSTLKQGADTTALEANLRMLYEHARRWAPGLSVPYKVPRVSLTRALAHPGQYTVDSAGWVAIDVSAELASRAPMLSVILAHEVCHHILDLTELDDKRDRARTERMTDLAMFICGFGDIVSHGCTSIQQTASGYVRTHLGYLEPCDYDYAYVWVLGARVANGLPGMRGSQAVRVAMTTSLRLPDPMECLQRVLAHRILDRRVRERVIRHYATRSPQETAEHILQHILEDYAREEALTEAAGMNEPGYKNHPTPKLLTPQQIARINKS